MTRIVLVSRCVWLIWRHILGKDMVDGPHLHQPNGPSQCISCEPMSYTQTWSQPIQGLLCHPLEVHLSLQTKHWFLSISCADEPDDEMVGWCAFFLSDCMNSFTCCDIWHLHVLHCDVLMGAGVVLIGAGAVFMVWDESMRFDGMLFISRIEISSVSRWRNSVMSIGMSEGSSGRRWGSDIKGQYN